MPRLSYDLPEDRMPGRSTGRYSARLAYGPKRITPEGIEVSLPKKEAPDLPFWKDSASIAEHPYLYATAGSVYETGGQVKDFIIDSIPYAKYLRSEDRKDFMQLTKEDQHKALMYDMLAAELFVVAPMAIEKLGLGAKMAGQAAVKRFTKKGGKLLMPAEDAIELVGKKGGVWENFSYGDAAVKELTGRGFAKDEALVVADSIVSGKSIRLTQFHREKALRNYPEGVSIGFKKWLKTDFKTGTKASDELVAALDYETLQAKHWTKIWSDNMGAAGFSPIVKKEIFNIQASKYIDKELIKNITIRDVDEKMMANVIKDMFLDPTRTRKAFQEGAGEFWFSTIQPQRTLFGAGEKLWKTKSKILDVTQQGLKDSNSYKMDWAVLQSKMLEERGFGKFIRETDELGTATSTYFKPNKNFNQKNMEAADEILHKVGRLSEDIERLAASGLSKAEMKAQEQGIRNQIVGILDPLEQKGGPVSHLVKIHHDLNDKLYSDHMRRKIPQLFHETGLTETGIRQVDNMMKRLEYGLHKNFSTGGAVKYDKQLAFVNSTLDRMKKMLTVRQDGTHPWFKTAGGDLESQMRLLNWNLTTGKKGGFPSLLENYVSRMAKEGTRLDTKWHKNLTGKNLRAGYIRERKKLIYKDEPLDYLSRIEARIGAQAKELYLYPKLDKIAKQAENLPDVWKEQTDYLISRVLNRPSDWDHWLAGTLERTLGAGKRFFTGNLDEGLWDTQRINKLSQNIQNFTYMGFLGIKPYSVMRNYFQPLITGAADLGGISDIVTIARGAALATKPGIRAEIRKMGGISDFVPELAKTPIIPRVGAAGKLDEVRDVCMWMFKKSDQHTRYIMGGAAMVKWDKGLAKVGKEITEKNIGRFFKSSGITKRNPWVVAEIEEKILKNDVAGARKMFIRDVIADTQYLYGTIEAPTLAGAKGATGRVAFTFQSWWMNYGALLGKWMRTSQGPGGATERYLTWMLSSAIAEQTMETMWGREAAMREVAFGPLPLGDFGLPPAFRLVADGLRTIKTISMLPFGEDPKTAEKQLMGTLKQTVNFMPGGNQLMSSAQAYEKNEWKGLSESILGFHRKKEPSAIEKFLGRERL